MKNGFSYLFALILFSTTSHASNNYLGKAPERGVIISIRPETSSYKQGETARFTGIIKVVGKKSFWDDFVDWFNPKKKTLLEEFNKEGIEISGSFPSSAIDVTSLFILESKSEDEIKFTFQSQPLAASDLNQLSLKIYNNTNDKKKLKQLSSIQGKLEKRLVVLQDLKKHYNKNHALKSLIEIVEREIAKLEKLRDKIEDRLNSDDNLIADNSTPLQVDNLTSSLSRISTSMNGFRLSIDSSVGAAFSGTETFLTARVAKIGAKDSDDDFYKNYGKQGYRVEVYRNGSLFTSQDMDVKTGIISIGASSEKLSVSNSNKTDVFLYRTEKGKKKDRIAYLTHDQIVLKDAISPKWLASSSPAVGDIYVKTIEDLKLTVQDAYGRINFDSLVMTIKGTSASGPVNYNLVPSLIAIKSPNNDEISWSGSLSYLTEGAYVLSAAVADLSANKAMPDPYKTNLTIDRTAPVISVGHAEGYESPASQMMLKVFIQDISPVDTLVKVNNGEVKAFNVPTFETLVDLKNGSNSIEIKSKDKAGNEKTVVSHVTFDTTPPVLAITYPTQGFKVYAKSFPFDLDLSGSSNEPLTTAKVNGVALSLGADAETFSGVVKITSAGILSVSVEGKDIAGNIGFVSSNIEAILDTQAPAIQLTHNGPSLTNASSSPVSVKISDLSPVQSEIFVNQVSLFRTGAVEFDIPFELTVEGRNTFKIVSTDSAGNKSESAVVEVVRDTMPAQILSITPSNGDEVPRMIVPISGVVNEKLKSISVNGAALTTKDLGFSGQYVSSIQGNQDLVFTFEDLAGNVSSYTLNIKITDVLLVPSLLSLVPDLDNVHMWIIGAPSAVRPGAEITASAAIFGNSGDTVGASDGSFRIRLKKFTDVDIEVEDTNTGEEAHASLTFNNSTTLAGIVKDSAGVPLPNVSIGFSGSSVQTYTDDTGNFLIQDPPTGDQTLVIDGSSVPQSTQGTQRKFFATKIALNIGFGQANVLGLPVFLTPLLLDGSQTEVKQGVAAAVTSVHAPGVQLDIPANSSVFPDGKNIGSINIVSIDADKATTPVPENFVPTKVLALEPSGTRFTKPVQIKVPNDNELPSRTPMVFFSMNSAKGIWELDGYGRVSDDGNSVISNSNSGITHFSLVYAVPLSPSIRTLENPSLLGVTTDQGGLNNSIKAPSFKVLGKTIVPTIMYKSGWANPTAVVSNSFVIPDIETLVSSGTGSGDMPMRTYEVQKETCETRTYRLGPFSYSEEEICKTFWRDWYSQLSFTFNWESTNFWIPDSISSQFFVGLTASDEVTFSSSNTNDAIKQIAGDKISNAAATEILKQTGIPRSSIVSYAVQLKDPNSGEFVSSGIHPSLTRYQIKMRNLTVTTSTISSREKFGPTPNLGSYRDVQQDPTTSIASSMLEYLPGDMHANILVQNKTKSKVGRGWDVVGNQRITNPDNSTIMIEQGDGSVATYAVNSIISTLYDGKGKNVDLSKGVDLSKWPYAYLPAFDNGKDYFIGKIDLSQSSQNPVNIGSVQTQAGKLASQGYYQCSSTTKCDIGGCYPDYSTGQFSSVVYDYKVKPSIGGIVQATNGELFFVDSTQHSLVRNNGATKVLGQVDQLDNLLVLENRNYDIITREFFNKPSADVNQSCQSLFGSDCSAGVTQTAKFNCSLQKLVRTCTPSDGLAQVVKCKTTQAPQYLYTNSTGQIGVPASDLTGLNSPTYVTESSDGKIVFSDTGNNRVLRYDPSSGQVSVIAGNGQNWDFGDGNDAKLAGLFHPKGLAFDPQGNLYISSEAGFIRKVSLDGKISTFAGRPLNSGGVLSDSAGRLAIALNNPQGMVFNSSGDKLYVSDTGNNRVLEIDLNTEIVNKVAGNGQCSVDVTDDGSPAIFSSICQPTSLAFDSSGGLLITDSGHQRIRRVAFSAEIAGALAFAPSAQDSSKLFRNADGTWKRIYRDGSFDSFNANGLQTLSTDTLNRITAFNYDSDSNLNEIVYPNGQKLVFDYSSGYLKSITDPAGRKTLLSQSGGNLSEVVFPDGSGRIFQYDANGLMTEELNEVGSKTKFQFNDWSRLVKVIQADGSEKTINDAASQTMANSYNAGNEGPMSNPGLGDGQSSTKVTDANNNLTTMLQDHMGFISVIKDALGNVTKVTRDNFGRPTKIERPDQSIVTIAYDPATGDLLEWKDVSTGIMQKAVYDIKGHVKSIISGSGKVSSFDYDHLTGAHIKSVSPDGSVINYEYNGPFGLLSKEIISRNGKSISQTYSYDGLGNLIAKIDSQGNVVAYEYDSAGSAIKAVRSADGVLIATKVFERDLRGRLIRVADDKGAITKYSYLKTGQLEEVEDSLGKKTKYSYNNLGHLIEKTEPNGAKFSMDYDSNGNRIRETDPTGKVRKYVYDALNRVSEVQLSDDRIKVSYNSRGQISVLENTSASIAYDNDTMGRLMSERVNGLGINSSYPSILLSYLHDKDGNLESMQSSFGNISYGYDLNGRLDSLQSSWAGTYSFNYDDIGHLDELVRSSSGIRSSFTANNIGLQTQLSHAHGATSLYSETIGYDKRNMLVSRQSTEGQYQYDLDLNQQLVGVSGPSETLAISYDSLGNRSSYNGIAYSYEGTSGRLVDDGDFVYQYDANGNVSAKTSKDGAKPVYKYFYNSMNRLVKVQSLEKTSGSLLTETSYDYDPTGRRIRKQVTDTQNPNNTRYTYSRYYVYSGENLVAEYNGNAVLLARYTNASSGFDSNLSVTISSAGVSEGLASRAGTFELLKDRAGSVVAVADGTGLVQRFHYGTFGDLVSITDKNGNVITSNPILTPRFTFVSREWESESNLVYMRARYYDPSTGRFLQEDPFAGVLSDPLSVVNKYAYASNNPVSFADPTGYSTTTIVCSTACTGSGSSGGEGGGDDGSKWGLGAYNDSHTSIVGNAYPPKAEVPGPIFNAPTTLSLNLGGTAIWGAGYTASVGMYLGTTGEGWLDAGISISWGTGFGYGIGIGVDGVVSSQHTRYQEGDSTNYTLGRGIAGTTVTFDENNRITSASYGAGVGTKYTANITNTHTVTFGVRDVLRWMGYPVK